MVKKKWRAYSMDDKDQSLKFSINSTYAYKSKTIVQCVVVGRNNVTSNNATNKFWSTIPLYDIDNLTVLDYLHLVAKHHEIELLSKGNKVHLFKVDNYFEYNVEKDKKKYQNKLQIELQGLSFEKLEHQKYSENITTLNLSDLFSEFAIGKNPKKFIVIIHKIGTKSKRLLWDLKASTTLEEADDEEFNFGVNMQRDKQVNKGHETIDKNSKLMSPFAKRKEIQDAFDYLQSGGGGGPVYELTNTTLPITKPRDSFNVKKKKREDLARYLEDTETRCKKLNGTTFKIQDTSLEGEGHGFFISSKHLVTCVHVLRDYPPKDDLQSISLEEEKPENKLSITDLGDFTYEILYPSKLNKKRYNDFQNLDVAIIEIDRKVKTAQLDFFDIAVIHDMDNLDDPGVLPNPNHPSLQSSIIYYYQDNSKLTESIHTFVAKRRWELFNMNIAFGGVSGAPTVQYDGKLVAVHRRSSCLSEKKHGATYFNGCVRIDMLLHYEFGLKRHSNGSWFVPKDCEVDHKRHFLEVFGKIIPYMQNKHTIYKGSNCKEKFDMEKEKSALEDLEDSEDLEDLEMGDLEYDLEDDSEYDMEELD